jgi:hypothetical protein
MVNLSDQNTFELMSYSLGNTSKGHIIYQQDDLFIAHEQLFQNATPTRFYHNQADTFVFIVKGELYLQQKTQQNALAVEKETVLKTHQGIWLAAHTISNITLLTPMVELCLIRLKPTRHVEENELFQKVSSGTVELIPGRNHIKTWPLWQGPSGKIVLEFYPPQYKETLYYQKTATQYLLPLNGIAFISNGKKPPEVCSMLGRIITKQERRAILNPSSKSITLLSVMTAQQSKGRILVLTNHKAR